VLPGARFRGHIASLAPATGAQFSVIPPENFSDIEILR
jgi:membrane fusion protein, multidrug efflux system